MLIASIMAYYVDGLFSISQRQVAGRLPFYLILGLALGLIDRHYNLLSKLLDYLRPLKKIWHRPYLFLATVILLIGWNGYYFSRWAYVQYQLVAGYKLSLAARLNHYDNALKIHRDVYMLDYLTQATLKARDYENLIGYAKAANQVIADYRITNYRQCLAQIKLELYHEAKVACQAQKESNPYLAHNNPLVDLSSFGFR